MYHAGGVASGVSKTPSFKIKMSFEGRPLHLEGESNRGFGLTGPDKRVCDRAVNRLT